MPDEITHLGTVQSCDGTTAAVLIDGEAQCGSCSARIVCNPAHEGTTLLQAGYRDIPDLEEGDRVVVVMRGLSRLVAVWWALVLPCAVMVAVIAIVHSRLDDQGISAACGIVSIIIYYTIFYLLRRHLERQWHWVIKIRLNHVGGKMPSATQS